ncbi:MAG: S8 family serine peptidase, partial [Acidobacteriia bacterium]|nr:S8 family serine peptidase [Terriglobia bacterium]
MLPCVFRILSLFLSGVLLAISPAAMSQTTGATAVFEAGGSGNNASFAAARSGPKYAPGRVILRFRAGVPVAAQAATHSRVGATVLRRFHVVPGLQIIQLPAGWSVEEALYRYRNDPNIVYAEPDTVLHVLETVPNDPSFSSLWAMKNTGQSGGKIDVDIDATDAWTLSTGSNSVYVGVIDTGMDYNHPDLSNNIYSSASDCNLNGVDDDGDGYVDDCHGIDTVNHDSDPMDDHDHGSHVSGIIGATGNNAVGVVGVNWRVTIIPCKSLDWSGSGLTSAAIECLDWFATLKDHGLNIIATNNSWGGGGSSQAVADAIEATMQRGILFIVAAGNGGSDSVGDNNDIVPTFPANYSLPNVIAVAATDRNDLFGSFSNFGRHTVHVGAPGVSILSTVRNNSYAAFSGTSMAAPHVAGAAALLKAQNPSLDWRAIKNLLLSSAEPVVALSGKTITGGRLNVYSAMSCSNESLFSPLFPYGNATVVTGSTITFAALNIDCAQPAGNVTVGIDSGAETVILRDDGASGDTVTGDGIYTAQWSPATAGNHTYTFQDGSGGTIRVLAPYSAPTSTTYSYRPITGTNLLLADDDVRSLNLNTPGLFPVTIGGLTFETISISANGVLSLNNFNTYTNGSIPNSSAQVLIAPWWDDLSPQPGTDQNVFYQVTGSAPNRELVIEWRDVPHYETVVDVTKTVMFQAVFPESSPSSDILFNYADVNFDDTNASTYNAGGSATVGVQIDPTHGVQYSYNQTTLANGLALLFKAVSGPTPPSLTVVSPNGGESWSLGSTHTIQWSYTGTPGTTVKVELLRNGSLHSTLGTSTSIGTNGTGSFIWTPSTSLPLDTTYTIRITSNQNSSYTASSDANFSLTPPPSLTLVS